MRSGVYDQQQQQQQQQQQHYHHPPYPSSSPSSSSPHAPHAPPPPASSSGAPQAQTQARHAQQQQQQTQTQSQLQSPHHQHNNSRTQQQQQHHHHPQQHPFQQQQQHLPQSQHLSPPQQFQHHQQQQQLPGRSRTPLMPSTNDADHLAQAIEKLGTNISTQLSGLAVQMSSLLSMMSHLVEQQQQQQPQAQTQAQNAPLPPRRRFDDPSLPSPSAYPAMDAPGPSSWHHRNGDTLATTMPRHLRDRRDSGHPFAFDPNSDAHFAEPSSSSHARPTFPPLQSQMAPDAGAADMMDSGGDDFLGDAPPAADRRTPLPPRRSSGGLSPRAGEPTSASASNAPGLLSHAMSFDQAGGSSAKAGPSSATTATTDTHSEGGGSSHSPRQAGSSSTYGGGSVRPFTAVDHSNRPAPPPFAPISASYASASADEATEREDEARIRSELEGSAGSSKQADANGSLSIFDRPSTRNPSYRHAQHTSSFEPRQGQNLSDAGLGGAAAGPSSLNASTSSSSTILEGRSLYTSSDSSDYPGSASASASTSYHSYPPQPYGVAASQSHHHAASPHMAFGSMHAPSPSTSDDGTIFQNGRKRVGRPPGPTIGALARKKRDSSGIGGSGEQQRSPGEGSGGGGGSSAAAGGGASSSSSASTGLMGDYKFWAFTPPVLPESKLRSMPIPRWRTLQSARLDLQRKTGRTMAKLGRLPLKDYLEVSQPEYLAARKTGRAAYNEWLDPLVRLAKQDHDRVRACTNYIEYCHPMLAQCEGNFKAKQLLQQIIDNAIDESTNAKKKQGGGRSGGSQGGGDSGAGENEGTSPEAGSEYGGSGSAGARGGAASTQTEEPTQGGGGRRSSAYSGE